MDRKQWLTTVYREANIFLERHSSDNVGGEKISSTEIDELEPELHAQVQEVIGSVDSLEDLIKHSLLKTPPPDLWYGESNWQRVLISVATACLMHDVKGVANKIAEGVLPKTPSTQLLDAL